MGKYGWGKLIFWRFGRIGFYVFAVDPIENCHYCPVKLRIQINVVRRLHIAY